MPERLFTKLDYLKSEGLKQLSIQIEVADCQKQLSKESLIDIIDPKIRSINKKSIGSWQEKPELNPEQ